jgi:MarR family transcriptional regulator, organic hydroperoxide resistance regulator
MEEIFNNKELVFSIVSGRASTAINRRLHRNFRANDIALTPEQWLVLQYLSLKDGISQQELANITYKDQPSITRLLDNLEKHSLIARLADRMDKRSNLIHITKAGQIIHHKARVIVLQTMQKALNGIAEDEIHAGEKTLKKIFKNLE